MAGGVFICYRLEESVFAARAIYDRVAQRFGPENVFLNVDNIDVGVDWFNVLTDRVGACDALVAVIGRNWLSWADKDNRRRIDDPNDFVRIEVETALKRDVRVIPVLLDGAVMPQASDLPQSLRSFARRQSIEISHTRFEADVEQLTGALGSILKERRARETAEAAGKEQGRQEATKPPNKAKHGARPASEAVEVRRRWDEERERQEAAPKTGHLFISYCNEDEAEAQSLVECLEKRGQQCWYASRDVQFNYQKEIVEAIRSAAALTVVISERANSSDEIPKEISLARKYKVKTIPVRIEDTWPNGALEYELANTQNVDLFKGRDLAIGKLIRLLGSTK